MYKYFSRGKAGAERFTLASYLHIKLKKLKKIIVWKCVIVCP